MYTRKIFLAVFIGYCFWGFSQKIQENRANWFAYVGQYKISPKWGYHLEAQFRMDGDLGFSKQNLFRLGVVYYPTSNAAVTVGYALVNTYNPTILGYFGEDRLWEQYQHNHKWNGEKNIFSNRIRLEQRFVDQKALVAGEVQKIATNFQFRFRYLNRNLIHITNFNDLEVELYGVIQDEVFVVVGANNVNTNFIDQNRFFAGLGIQYSKKIRFELGYMNQFVNLMIGSQMMNHTVSFSIFHHLPLYKG